MMKLAFASDALRKVDRDQSRGKCRIIQIRPSEVLAVLPGYRKISDGRLRKLTEAAERGIKLRTLPQIEIICRSQGVAYVDGLHRLTWGMRNGDEIMPFVIYLNGTERNYTPAIQDKETFDRLMAILDTQL